MHINVVVLAMAAVACGSVTAAEPRSTPGPGMESSASRQLPPMTEHHPSFRDADLRLVAEVVGQATGHEFILAPEVCGQFTAEWQEPISSDHSFSDFVRMLRTMGYAVAQEEAKTRISIPDAAGETTRGTCRDYPEYVHQELLIARELAWRSFFQKDLSAVERILAPDLIAIQEAADRWDDRATLMKMARSMSERGVQLVRLEFPRTEIRLFGDTALLYYTYIMEQRLGDKIAVESGRGSEVFVRRDDRWVDAGWHLDSGAFQQRGGSWVRLGEPVPAPISPGVVPTQHQ